MTRKTSPSRRRRKPRDASAGKEGGRAGALPLVSAVTARSSSPSCAARSARRARPACTRASGMRERCRSRAARRRRARERAPGAPAGRAARLGEGGEAGGPRQVHGRPHPRARARDGGRAGAGRARRGAGLPARATAPRELQQGEREDIRKNAHESPRSPTTRCAATCRPSSCTCSTGYAAASRAALAGRARRPFSSTPRRTPARCSRRWGTAPTR